MDTTAHVWTTADTSNSRLLKLFSNFIGENTNGFTGKVMSLNCCCTIFLCWLGQSDDQNCRQHRMLLKNAKSVLLKSLGNINYTDDRGLTILHHFLGILNTEWYLSPERLSQATEILTILLDRGASLDIFDHRNYSPIEVALERDKTEILQLLLRKFEKICLCYINNCPEHRYSNDSKFLHFHYSKYSDKLLLIFLEKEFQFTIHSSSNETHIIITCKYSTDYADESQKLKIIDRLISMGHDVNAIDTDGYSALHYAVKNSMDHIVKKLIKLDADVNLKIRNGHTPLYLALKGENLSLIEMLLKAGVNANAKIEKRVTPLMFALLNISDNTAIVRCLIKNGADVNYQNDNWKYTTPFIYALMRSVADNVVDMIENGADINSYLQYSGLKPIHIALLRENAQIFDLLAEKCFEMNDPTECGLTMLHLAAGKGFYKIVERLIERGVDVNHQEPMEGLAPMHMVSMRMRQFEELINRRTFGGRSSISDRLIRYDAFNMEVDNSAVIKLLIKAGANVNIQDSRGLIPLHYAISESPDYIQEGDVLPTLLKFGAHVNRQAGDGFLPLYEVLKIHNASLYSNRHVSALNWLIRFGADLTDIQPEMIKQIRLHGYSELHVNMIMFNIAGLSAINACGPECDSYQRLYENCSKEVKKLKNYLLEDGISLYDWLHKNHTRAPPFYLSGIPLELQTQFPLYYEIIQIRYRYVRERIKLLEPARLAWKQITKIHLPEACIEHILFYLNNRHLHLLTDYLKT